jgi:hypothetical protein
MAGSARPPGGAAWTRSWLGICTLRHRPALMCLPRADGSAEQNRSAQPADRKPRRWRRQVHQRPRRLSLPLSLPLSHRLRAPRLARAAWLLDPKHRRPRPSRLVPRRARPSSPPPRLRAGRSPRRARSRHLAPPTPGRARPVRRLPHRAYPRHLATPSPSWMRLARCHCCPDRQRPARRLLPAKLPHRPVALGPRPRSRGEGACARAHRPRDPSSGAKGRPPRLQASPLGQSPAPTSSQQTPPSDRRNRGRRTRNPPHPAKVRGRQRRPSPNRRLSKRRRRMPHGE